MSRKPESRIIPITTWQCKLTLPDEAKSFLLDDGAQPGDKVMLRIRGDKGATLYSPLVEGRPETLRTAPRTDATLEEALEIWLARRKIRHSVFGSVKEFLKFEKEWRSEAANKTTTKAWRSLGGPPPLDVEFLGQVR